MTSNEPLDHQEVRDDLDSLPLPPEAKAYARRKGLASMMRQPADFCRVNAMLSNPGRPDLFKNYDEGEPVRHAFNESYLAKLIGALDFNNP